MPFRPKNERHAIQEVVFVLNYQRAFNQQEVNAVIASHDRWKADLPGLKPMAGFQIEFGEDAQVQQTTGPLSGVSFDAHKRDGSLDWRLRIQDKWIAVNCLSYTRWAEVSARARKLLSDASSIASAADNPVVGIALQYIDVFEWVGNIDGYRLDELLDKDSDLVLPGLFEAGPLWHLHQGRFRMNGLPAAGRLLERVHLDGAQYKDVHNVKIDITLRLDLAEPVAGAAAVFEGKAPLVDPVLEYLHKHNKELLEDLITAEMAKRIELNA